LANLAGPLCRQPHNVLMRLPTQKASVLAELLPHNWVSAGKV